MSNPVLYGHYERHDILKGTTTIRTIENGLLYKGTDNKLTINPITSWTIIYNSFVLTQPELDEKFKERFELSKSIATYYKDCLPRLTAIKDICECRSTEGKYINQEIAAMRSTIFDLIRKRKNVIKYVPSSLPYCAEQLFPLFPLPADEALPQSSVLLQKHMLDVIGSDRHKDLEIVVFNVFNNSPNLEERTLYIDINDLKSVYQRWYIYSHYFEGMQNNSIAKEHPLYNIIVKYTNHTKILEDYLQIFEAFKNKIMAYSTREDNPYQQTLAKEILNVDIHGAKPFFDNEWNTTITEEGCKDLKVLIDFIQNINNTSPLGTLEFMDHIARMDPEDSQMMTCTKYAARQNVQEQELKDSSLTIRTNKNART
jgi:hypothetical protein